MELFVFINEMSIRQQFTTLEEAQKAFKSFLQLLDSIVKSQLDVDVFYDNIKLFERFVTQTHVFENLFSDKDLKRKYQISRDKYWKSWRKQPIHHSSEFYFCNEECVSDTSVAEACEYTAQYTQDCTILLNLQASFATPEINVTKGDVSYQVKSIVRLVDIENLLPTHSVTAYPIDSTVPPRDAQTVLSDPRLFTPTSHYQQGRRIYERIGYNEYWYVDNCHYNGSAHLEFFDKRTLRFLGICQIDDVNKDDRRIRKKDRCRTINVN